MRRRMDGLHRLQRAAPWPKAVGVGFAARLPCWLPGRRDDCRPHPVLAGRYAHGAVCPVVFGDGAPPDRAGFVSLAAQTLLQQLPAGFRRGGHPPIHPCRVCALVCLSDTSERQELVGRGSHQQLLAVFARPPCRVRGGAIETFLPASSMPFHRVPMEVSPRGGGGGCSPFRAKHRLTSPTIRMLLACSPVRTTRQSAPLRGGSLRLCGPSRSLPGRRALVPSSPTLCSIPLPCGRDTPGVGSLGLPQWLLKKPVVRSGGRLSPGGRFGGRHPQALAVILPPSPCGDGLSASWAMALSRGFTLTLPWRSTCPAFPRPPPRRGWQRSEHCSQSFAPRMTRPHVWVGTPGHHRARSGAWSPSSILLHGPCEVQRMDVCSPPGHRHLKAGVQERSCGSLAQEPCVYGQSRGVMPFSCAYLAADASTSGRTSA
jgi:hypothetical protein